MSKIILFAGKMQSGKTTCAQIIFNFLNKNDYYVYKTGFAEELKEFCIENEWITRQQAYGTQEDKNSPSPLFWSNMPDTPLKKYNIMTAREVLQHIGTNIFRKIDPNFWVKKLSKKINTKLWYEYQLVTIDDARFPNEILEMKKLGAITIYLTRNNYNNQHQSETELDNFNKSNFDYIIDNQNFSLDELKKSLLTILYKENLIGD